LLEAIEVLPQQEGYVGQPSFTAWHQLLINQAISQQVELESASCKSI
jgi:hypothetical protein